MRRDIQYFLVVDDDELSRELLTLMLEVEGHEVEAAASGAEAIARLESAVGPNVILTDIQMPGLTGSALAQALRAALPTETRILAMSGSQPPPDALLGFDGFLLKPFTIDDLNSAITSRPRQKHSSYPATSSFETPTLPLDEEIYGKLCDLMPPGQMEQMVDLCSSDVRARVANMHHLAAAADDIAYRREAHSIKGGCGFIGAAELHALADEAERDGLAGSKTTTVSETLNQLSAACERLERILVERVKEPIL